MPASLKLPSIPAPLEWKNIPVDFGVEQGDVLRITAGDLEDWFNDPAGSAIKGNAPVALFAPPDATYLLSARVEVAFESNFDAGVLFLYASEDRWAKLCFEFSPQKQPMVVSVVTRGASDDANSAIIEGRAVYLRIARMARSFAFHYSLDGAYWNLARHFALDAPAPLRLGFSAQSPTGQGCTVRFSEISYRAGVLGDLRSGE